MADITFHEERILGQGNFIRVRYRGLLGMIYHAGGVYQFYDSDHATLGGPKLEHEDLEALKAAIRSR